MDAVGLPEQAAACRAVSYFNGARGAAARAAWVAWPSRPSRAAGAAEAARAARAAGAARAAKAAGAEITRHCIEIVSGELAIGNQAADVDVATVVARMDQIRARETV